MTARERKQLAEAIEYGRALCGVAIYLHTGGGYGSGGKLIMEWKGFTAERYTRWAWYFEYRAALLKVAAPKQHVEIRKYRYLDEDVEAAKKRVIARKLRAAKGKLTQWQNKLEEFKKDWNLLFSYENEPNYLAALAKIERQKQLITWLENEAHNE
jgi:hypothetical protein